MEMEGNYKMDLKYFIFLCVFLCGFSAFASNIISNPLHSRCAQIFHKRSLYFPKKAHAVPLNNFDIFIPYFREVFAGKEKTFPLQLIEEIISQQTTNRELRSYFSKYTAQANAGNSLAQLYVGLLFFYSKNGNKETAAYYIEQSAGQGNQLATLFIGLMYYHGVGRLVLRSKALHYLEQLAQEGNSLSQFMAALINENKSHLRAYAEKTFSLYQASARQNVTAALFNLGLKYIKGTQFDLPKKDSKKGFDYIKASAMHGYVPAWFVLGLMYYFGEGVAKDMVRAYVYVTGAVYNGYKDTLKMKERISREMSEEERNQVYNFSFTAKEKPAPPLPRLWSAVTLPVSRL